MKLVNIDSNTLSLVELDSLTVHPRNPRNGNVAEIAKSMEVNGFYGSLIAQKSTRCVLAGNHRLMAARKLGVKALPVIWVDVSDADAYRIMLADNRTSDVATYDDEKLTELLEMIHEEHGSLIGTGYSLAELSDLAGIADKGYDPDEEWSGMPECDNDDLKPHRQILVSFMDDSSVEDFAQRLEVNLTSKTKSISYPQIAQVSVTDKVFK